MSNGSTSMWHWEEYEPEKLPKRDDRTRNKLPALVPFDPDMVMVFAGPGGLPYLLRMFVRRRFVRLYNAPSVPEAQRLAS